VRSRVDQTSMRMTGGFRIGSSVAHASMPMDSLSPSFHSLPEELFTGIVLRSSVEPQVGHVEHGC